MCADLLMRLVPLKIRQDTIQLLIDLYERLPTAKYYEVPSLNYRYSRNDDDADHTHRNQANPMN